LNIKDELHNNNRIIYKTIIEKIKTSNIKINNNTFGFLIKEFTKQFIRNKEIKFNHTNKNKLILDIVKGILKSIYLQNFNKTKEEIINKIPCTIKDQEFIKQVQNNQNIFDLVETSKNTNKKKIENKFPNIDLTSDRNIISRYVYNKFDTNKELITSDLKVNTINKAFDTINSYYAKKRMGLKSNFPKYLDKNSQYILPFYSSGRKKIDTYYRLTIGRYCSKNYLDIINDNNYICLNDNLKTQFKCYTHKQHLIDINDKKEIKNKYKVYILDSNGKKIPKYIDKSSEHIIHASYLNIKIPPILDNNNINLTYIEISPINNGMKYKVNFIYREKYPDKTIIDTKKITNYISIDLGMKNLLTIYDPSGRQIIISGKYLSKLNYTLNNKIDKLKNKLKKCNNKQNSTRIANLYIKKYNKINNYFNKLTKWLIKKYANKKIIIGYNSGWKTRVNMGKKNNRKFYEIPYNKLLKKILFKSTYNNFDVVLINESYTSKCDAFAFESIGKHDIYLGNRRKRGLFNSSTNKLINADLNGAINIMRKYFIKNKINFNKIIGENIFNPIKVNIFRDAN